MKKKLLIKFNRVINDKYKNKRCTNIIKNDILHN